MLTLNCPSCGAGVNFQSKASVFAVCSFCKSTLVRHDLNLENIGKIAELRDDLTPIQIGTSGVFRNENFEVVGRMKVAYEDGFWNEWFVILSSGEVGWLAEAQGFYALLKPSQAEIPSRGSIHVGAVFQFGKGDDSYYEVDDIHDVTCIYSEGELPVNAVQGRASCSVDLRGFEEQMGTIEYANNEDRLYIGAYQDFDKFAFKNLRPIDGW